MRRFQCVFYRLLGGKFCFLELEVPKNMLLEIFPIFQYFLIGNKNVYSRVPHTLWVYNHRY